MDGEGSPLVDLVLIDSGKKLIHVIKQIRELVDVGLAEAKDLAEKTPSVIASSVPLAKAEAARGLLEALGALVELKPTGSDSVPGRSLESGRAAGLRLLVDQGTLSENELLDARNALEDAPPGDHRKMVRMLTELHDLFKEGVLTESEFNTKKWEVLSRRWD